MDIPIEEIEDVIAPHGRCKFCNLPLTVHKDCLDCEAEFGTLEKKASERYDRDQAKRHNG